MSSSDIYQIKESPNAKKEDNASTSQRRRHRRVDSFDETVDKDVSKTNLRRRKNSGFRRFRHLMKKPEFSRKFWIIIFSILGVILAVLILWDWFYR